MSKSEVQAKLAELFSVYHVAQWLARFPDDHKFDPDTFWGDFVRYINSLPPILVDE